MKPYERRAAGAYPYFVLATWNARLVCFQDGKVFTTEDVAIRAAKKKPGRYRIAEVTENGRKDKAPFEVP